MTKILYYSQDEVEAPIAQGLLSDYAKATALELDVGLETIEPLIEGRHNFPGGFAPHGDFLVAQVAGEVAGCVGIQGVDKTFCEMRSLWVDPRWRGHGVAKSLIEASLKRASQIGFQKMGLDVIPSRLGPIYLYREFGFEDCPCFHEYEFDMVGFSKELGSG